MFIRDIRRDSSQIIFSFSMKSFRYRFLRTRFSQIVFTQLYCLGVVSSFLLYIWQCQLEILLPTLFLTRKTVIELSNKLLNIIAA